MLFTSACTNGYFFNYVSLTAPSTSLCDCRAGISLKTQDLYALVFLFRYLDLFTRYISL